jgi:ribonuclease-3
MMTARNLAALEEALGHNFQRRDLLDLALTHSSYAREKESQENISLGDNEQLEFLGDTVLALSVSEELFRRFPHFREGELSKLRAYLVSEKHLIQVAQALSLGEFLHLGRGEEKSGGRSKPAMLADALEAIIAAIYLDSGFDVARHFVLEKVLGPELHRLDVHSAGLPVTDYKSALQELLQATGRQQPDYALVKETGPEHKKTFTVEVCLVTGNATGVEFTGRGEGPTKKRAEQEAARLVLEYLTNLNPGPAPVAEARPW